jgi:U3 small nucleolar ribonucleoprotein protein LCP5
MKMKKMKYSRAKQEEEEIKSSEESLEESSAESIQESNSDSEADLYKQQYNTFEPDEESEREKYNPSESEKKEFVSSLNTIRVNAEEINQKMNSVLTNFSQSEKAEIKYGISYLDAKNYFMLVYLTDLLTYSLFKCSGESTKKIKSHSVIQQMIYIKTILEKTKVIDLKLKSQIDRLLKLGEKSLEETNQINSVEDLDENNFRPMILDNEDDEEEEEKQQVKYKVQRDFQNFFETNDENRKRKKQIEKVKEKVRNSEMYKEIREQFNDAPKEINPYDSEYSKFMKQVEEYEENNFTRLKVPKRELKKLKKLDRKQNDLADFGREFKNLENILNHDNKEEYQNQVKFINKKRAVGDSFKNQSNKRAFNNNSKKYKK